MALTEKSAKVLAYVQAHNDENMAYTDVAEGAGISDKAALGVINALVKKSLLTRVPAEIEIEAMDKDGNPTTKTKTINFIHCTEEGIADDVSEDEAE